MLLPDQRIRGHREQDREIVLTKRPQFDDVAGEYRLKFEGHSLYCNEPSASALWTGVRRSTVSRRVRRRAPFGVCVQNVNSAVIRVRRPVRTEFGSSHGPPGTNTLLYVRIALEFRML